MNAALTRDDLDRAAEASLSQTKSVQFERRIVSFRQSPGSKWQVRDHDQPDESLAKIKASAGTQHDRGAGP